MAATNLPHALDPALRRPGRFDREIAFGAPDEAARRDIVAVHLAEAPVAEDADLDALAAATAGYVGADLAALAREAALAALARAAAAARGDQVAADALWITCPDLDAARAQVGPSALRETQLELPDTRWSDVGGLADAKAALVEAVVWPTRHPAAHRRLGIGPVSGMLLAGPPGGGKTSLDRALAAADPALERVVGQLLVEIDGIAASRGVFLLGATNRPRRSTPRCCGPAGSNAWSPSARPTPPRAARSSPCTRRARRWPRPCRSTRWPPRPRVGAGRSSPRYAATPPAPRSAARSARGRSRPGR